MVAEKKGNATTPALGWLAMKLSFLRIPSASSLLGMAEAAQGGLPLD